MSRKRLEREKKTLTCMIRIYCRAKHGTERPCGPCSGMLEYSLRRLESCRFGARKPTCLKCPVHCYQRERRDAIKVVMRYAGPRMLWEHPWLSMWHVLDGWFRKPEPLPVVGTSGKSR